MEALKSEITEWRSFVGQGPAVDGRDVEELEAHLRDQIADLNAAGLAADEAFLDRGEADGGLDDLSREFAREHSGRLWRQLILAATTSRRRCERLARGAAVRSRGRHHGPDRTPGRGLSQRRGPLWLRRNVSLLVIPFVAGWFARRRQLDLGNAC